MKILGFCGVALLALATWFVAANSTLLLNSRLDRLLEDNLPKIIVEDEGTIYCRMKADDFRFPLPSGGISVDPAITSGGFDAVEGSVEVLFSGKDHMSPQQYEKWLSDRLQIGGWVTATESPSGGILISFSYFGDK